MRSFLALLLLGGTIGAFAEAAPEAAPPVLDFASATLDPAGEVLPPEVGDLPWVDHPRVARALAFYLGPGRDWVTMVLDRARPYRDFIRQKIDEMGMPREIFWLAAVESGFNPGATSRVGATGLWQFMRNSVGGYGMHINAFVDERRDWWKSTEGALQKLKDNYGRLGDWYLALAAYNAGSGKISGVLKRAKGDRNYWSLLDKGLLPKETAEYVPQLLALAKLAAEWDRQGFPVDWSPSPTWDRVAVDRMVDLRMLADAAQVPVEELKDANKELVYHLTPVLSGGYQLKVKPEWADPIRQVLADPSLKLIKYYLYTVQKGDTLSQIAQWYGVSADMIARDNPGLRPSMLKIGQNLVIAALKDVGPYPGKGRA